MDLQKASDFESQSVSRVKCRGRPYDNTAHASLTEIKSIAELLVKLGKKNDSSSV